MLTINSGSRECNPVRRAKLWRLAYRFAVHTQWLHWRWREAKGAAKRLLARGVDPSMVFLLLMLLTSLMDIPSQSYGRTMPELGSRAKAIK